MIAALEKAGYKVAHHWGGPPTDDEVAALNENGVYYKGQKDIPDDAVVREVPERETIARVVGHGQDTTIYTHDDESIERLLAVAADAKS